MTSLAEPKITDFEVEEIVQHLFTGRYATITKVGRKYLTVKVHLVNVEVRWLPSNVRKT